MVIIIVMTMASDGAHLAGTMRRRRLVGEHAQGVTPQPCCDQFSLLARWEVDEAVDPPPYSNDASGLLVVREQRGRIAGGRGLLRGEQPSRAAILTRSTSFLIQKRVEVVVSRIHP